jgi:hypothetical protein
MEMDMAMNNEELQHAINDAFLALSKTPSFEPCYSALNRHIEYLLKIQAERAGFMLAAELGKR